MTYQDMKVPDLKSLCQERGLSTGGSKNTLIERLRQNEEEQQQQQQQQHQEAHLEATSPLATSSQSAVLAANAASPVVEVAPLQQLSLPQQPQQPQQPQTEVSPGANVVVKQEPGASPIVEPLSVDEPLPTSRDRANDIGSSTATTTTTTTSSSSTTSASDASATTSGSKDTTAVAGAPPAISQGVNRKLLSRMVHERANVSSHLHQYYGRAFNSAERFDYDMLRQKLTASFVYTDYEIPWWCVESYDTAMGVCRVPGRPTESIVYQ